MSAAEPDTVYLLSAAAVRERCRLVLAAAERDATRHFRLVPGRLDDAVNRIERVTRRRYPDLDVPYHSRWRHFGIGGVDRAALLAPTATGVDRARARVDLAVVSVLLDAGAGPQWRYREADTGAVFARSEGLAVASLRAMQSGLFSADPSDPWRVDGSALRACTGEALGAAMQSRSGNELAGLDGRAVLLRRLGDALEAHPEWFGASARPGNLVDHWRSRGVAVSAPDILRVLLQAFGSIWPGRPLGDCGRHWAVPGDGLVVFHKLSQWLAYSLVEPLLDAGIPVTDLDGLTGLAEYRNGGLLTDCGVLVPGDPVLLRQSLDPADEAVVEWRALTVALLDRLADRLRERLGKTAEEFPLAKLLEGGSWAAGREIALELRTDGRPPLTIVSDGTLF